MTKKPFFSIIIPTYNRYAFLRLAIESVLRQTYDDFELIIVDDGSTDNTKQIIEDFTQRYPLAAIRYFYQDHKGVSSARNRGIQKAKGSFICFLDSDDRFCALKLETTAQYIRQFPRIHIFHTDEVWYRNKKLLAQKIYHAKPDGAAFKQSLVRCAISISTACCRLAVFKTVGTFDEILPACEDYDFWLRTTSRYPVKLIPKALTIKEGGHPDQQSKRIKTLDKYRVYALKKLLDTVKLNAEQRTLTIKELKRKCAIYSKGAFKRNNMKMSARYKRIAHAYT